MNTFKKIVAGLSVTAVLATGSYIANEEYKTVAVAIDLSDSQNIQTKVTKGTVAQILEAQGIKVGAYDRVEPSLNTVINTENQTIKIFRAKTIQIKDGEQTNYHLTTYSKVGDILKDLKITLGEYDKLSFDKNAELKDTDVLAITRVEKIKETTKEEIDFETQEVADDTQVVGYKAVEVAGEKGEKEVEKEIIKENGKVVSENVITEKVTKEAVKEVIKFGTKSTYANASYGSSYSPSYSGVLSNGNSAGAIGAQAARQMQELTGVSASTWEYIIARESNGQVNAYNPSGASGLFQTMPGWGSTATVQDQINAAVRAYNAQGLRAWGM